jgi:hypothetical protein
MKNVMTWIKQEETIAECLASTVLASKNSLPKILWNLSMVRMQHGEL